MRDGKMIKKSDSVHYSIPQIASDDKVKKTADESEVIYQVSPQIAQMAARSANERVRAAKWDLNAAIFLFAILIVIVILLSRDVGIEAVAPIALFGLAMVWLIGWRRGKRLYPLFYYEELSKLKQITAKAVEEEKKDEDVDELVRKTLSERTK